MSKENTKATEVAEEELEDEEFDDDVVIEAPAPKPGILTRIGNGIAHAGEKIDAFNKKHKVISTIIEVGTGVAIGVGATATYYKSVIGKDNVVDSDDVTVDDYGSDDDFGYGESDTTPDTRDNKTK